MWLNRRRNFGKGLEYNPMIRVGKLKQMSSQYRVFTEAPHLIITHFTQDSKLIRCPDNCLLSLLHHVIAILLQSSNRIFQGMDPSKQFDWIWQSWLTRSFIQTTMMRLEFIMYDTVHASIMVITAYPRAWNVSEMSPHWSCKSEAAKLRFRAASVRDSAH